MGNHKFRISDMMPNAWFYKLRDMSRVRTTTTTASSHPINKKKPPPPNTTIFHKPYLSQPRRSYYTTTTEPPPPLPPTKPDKRYNSPTNPKASDTHFPDPPRKSSQTRRPKRKTIYKPSPTLVNSAACGCRNSVRAKSEWTHDQSPDFFFSSSSESSPEHDFPKSPVSELEENSINERESFDGLAPSWSSSCSCRVTSSTTDIIIDVNEKFEKKLAGFEFDTISELEHLPPILTKPAKIKETDPELSSEFEEREARGSLSIKIIKEDLKTRKPTTPVIRKPHSGVRLRANSARMAYKKSPGGSRRSVSSSGKSSRRSRKAIVKSFSGSVAIVKSSFDPESDFKESMVEMIVENNIRASKDLEELLACYLSLNSAEYHDFIVKAFEQIWFDMSHLRM